jgi:cyclase
MRVLTLSVLAMAFSGALVAQPPVHLKVHRLTPSVSWVEGDGGNSGVLVGQKSVIVVDAKMTPAGGRLLQKAAAKITPKPISAVILTHSDPDHVNGLAAFPEGLTILAQENNKEEQEAALAAGGPRTPPANRLPNRLITQEKEDLLLDGLRLELLHWGPAHTSGDLVVYLPEQKIVFTGDIFVLDYPSPLIHAQKGGTSLGWIESAKAVLALDADRFVVGHGGLQSKESLTRYVADAETKRTKIAGLFQQGQTLDQIRAAVGDPAPAANAKPSGYSFPTFTEVVYNELKNQAGAQ